MANQSSHYYPEKACGACGRMGCVYLDRHNGSVYLCADCVKRSGIHMPEEQSLPKELPRGREREELRRKNREMYMSKLNRQLETFLRLGFVEAMHMDEQWFLKEISDYGYEFASIGYPLPDDFPRVDSYPLFWEIEKKGNIPLLLMVSSTDLDDQRRLEIICTGNGFEYARGNVEVRHIQNYTGGLILIPIQIYCLFNVAPKGIKGHLTLTIDEGITLASCFPEKMIEWQSIICSASRYQEIAETDFLFLSTEIIGRKRLGIFYAPEHRLRISPEATCEKRQRLVPIPPLGFWHPLGENGMKKLTP